MVFAKMTRRGLVSAAAIGMAVPFARAEATDMTVTDALRARRSTRSYATRGIDAALRGRILWAAFGVNRPDSGGRTAPSWHGAADTMVYVADETGVGLYDAATDSVQAVSPTDIRPILSPQPFVKTAPLCLVMVSDLDRLDTAAGQPLAAQDQAVNAHVNSALVAQNVYLVCAALGLGTCLVGGADIPAITKALGLDERRMVTYVQPVGWPA